MKYKIIKEEVFVKYIGKRKPGQPSIKSLGLRKIIQLSFRNKGIMLNGQEVSWMYLDLKHAWAYLKRR